MLTGLAAWQNWGTLPDWLRDFADRPRTLYYRIVAPSIGALALLFTVGGLISRGPMPWTHPFSLVLMSWPIAPLAALMALESNLP